MSDAADARIAELEASHDAHLALITAIVAKVGGEITVSSDDIGNYGGIEVLPGEDGKVTVKAVE